MKFVGIGLGALACVVLLHAGELPDFPAVESSEFLPAIRAQIEHAEDDARTHPQDANAAGLLAMTLHAYQKYDAAAQMYLRAKMIAPQNFDWSYLLGATEVEQGHFDAAIESFQAALRIRPGELVAELRLAASLVAVARWDDAGALYTHILDKHSDSPQAWYGLGSVREAKDEHQAAVQCYAKACDLFPKYGAAQFALARELRRLGKPAEADRHLVSYSGNVSTEPPLSDPLFQRLRGMNQSVQSRLRRAAILEKNNQLAEAVQEHEAALMTDPENVQAHVNLIALYARLGDAAQAKRHFEIATKLNPGRSDAWYDYAVLLAQERDYQGAENAYRRALEINPHYAEPHNNLGVLYEQQGRLEDAAREFRDAIAERPDYPLARFHLGRILVNQRKYEEAIEQLRRALDPKTEQTPTYLYALGATYARIGERQRALEYLHTARDEAAAYHQQALLASIDRDLQTLEDNR